MTSLPGGPRARPAVYLYRQWIETIRTAPASEYNYLRIKILH